MKEMEHSDRIKQKIKKLEKKPKKSRTGLDVKKLKGFSSPELYRLRVGDYRIIYAIEGYEVLITE